MTTPDPFAGHDRCARCRLKIAFMRGVGWIHTEDDRDHDATPSPLATVTVRPGERWSRQCTASVMSGGATYHAGPCPVHDGGRDA